MGQAAPERLVPCRAVLAGRSAIVVRHPIRACPLQARTIADALDTSSQQCCGTANAGTISMFVGAAAACSATDLRAA